MHASKAHAKFWLMFVSNPLFQYLSIFCCTYFNKCRWHPLTWLSAREGLDCEGGHVGWRINYLPGLTMAPPAARPHLKATAIPRSFSIFQFSSVSKTRIVPTSGSGLSGCTRLILPLHLHSCQELWVAWNFDSHGPWSNLSYMQRGRFGNGICPRNPPIGSHRNSTDQFQMNCRPSLKRWTIPPTIKCWLRLQGLIMSHWIKPSVCKTEGPSKVGRERFKDFESVFVLSEDDPNHIPVSPAKSPRLLVTFSVYQPRSGNQGWQQSQHPGGAVPIA